MKNIKNKLESIDKDHYSLLIEIGKIAQDQNLKAYLVGGMVRDLLLGFNNLDIDIVVENNAVLLTDTLVKKISNCHLSAKHDRFHTAKVIFNINGKNIPVDLASTRQEIYEYPAALPKVIVSDLQKDLIRRDFTINALAVSLLSKDFGEIVDLFDGLEDLENKKIKILHEKSFIDDPTRIIRAVRFADKLDFEIEASTYKLLQEAINSKQFDNLIENVRGDRVKIEIRYLFNLPNIEQVMESFFASGISKMVSTLLTSYEDLFYTVAKSKYFISKEKLEKKWLIYLGIIISTLRKEEQDKIMKNLQLTGDEIKIIQSGIIMYKRFCDGGNELDVLLVSRELKNLSLESILIVKSLFVRDAEVTNLIDEYLDKISKIKLEITGQDLIALGVKEGKIIGEILEKVFEAKIKNPNMTKEDELREVKKMI